jgi:hypothetical protein
MINLNFSETNLSQIPYSDFINLELSDLKFDNIEKKAFQVVLDLDYEGNLINHTINSVNDKKNIEKNEDKNFEFEIKSEISDLKKAFETKLTNNEFYNDSLIEMIDFNSVKVISLFDNINLLKDGLAAFNEAVSKITFDSNLGIINFDKNLVINALYPKIPKQ